MSSVTTESEIELMGSVTGGIVDGCFYVFGGSRSSYEHVGTVLAIPLDSPDRPQRVSTVPSPRGNMTSASLGSKFFLVAGLQAAQRDGKIENYPTTTVECFDIATRQWTTCASLPEQRVKPGLVVVNGRLFVLSGRIDEVDANTIFAYDPKRDTWIQISNELPFASRHGAACAIDQRIYFSGGHTCRPGSGLFQSAMISFEPISGEFQQHAPMPEPRAAHALLTVEGSLFALGGLDATKASVSSVFRYDAQADRWDFCRPLNSPRSVFAAAVEGSEIVLAGGWKRMGKESNASFERYRPFH